MFHKFLLLIIGCVCWTPALAGDDWPRFRGPNGSGVAVAPGLPTTWSLDDFAWKTELDGVGHSSPVVKEGRVFTNSASKDGKRRILYVLDAQTGKILWQQELALTEDKKHLKSSHASSTPAVSDRTVVVTFADDNHHIVAAFNLDGTVRWKKDVGTFEGEHGHGASPIIWRGKVIVPNDQDVNSSYLALDENTGDILWETPRETAVASFSTPLILESPESSPQLITSSNGVGLTSIDPENGKVLWSTGALPQRTVSSPVFGNNLVYQTCGGGGRGTLLIGADPSLDVKEDSRIRYEAKTRVPYVPTPLIHNGLLFLWGDNGVLVCVDPAKKEPVWIERVSGNFSSSPVCVNDCLYNVSEDGEVVVIRASDTYELVGRSPLGAPSQSTPAIAGGRMYFHTEHHVLCLAPPK